MGLRSLTLREFVIIPALELEFQSGFTALTGETGAGKSILIDALQMVLGERADAGLVREGAKRCDIGARFDSSAASKAWLVEAGFADEEEILLRRTIDADGKSRAWINAVPCTASQQRELGRLLLSIHGQHAWQNLTQASSVRQLLDAYAGIDLAPLNAAWQDWQAAAQAQMQALTQQKNQAQERERLLWQIQELDKLSPQEAEWDSLNNEQQRLANAQTLQDAAHSTLQALEGGSEPGGAGAYALVQRSVQQLEAHSQIEPLFAECTEALRSALSSLEDCQRSLRNYTGRSEIDPADLQRLDDRIALWLSLARRFRVEPPALAASAQSWRHALQTLDSQSDMEALGAAVQSAKSAYAKAAKAVSQQRSAAAPRLAQAVTDSMQKLGMEGGLLQIALTPQSKASAYGLETVEFLVAGHAGVSPKPIGKVASGGELSRIALAIAVASSGVGEVPTLIFDEIDAGIGGAVGSTVGRMMHALGAHSQVLAVTHLPQVAACADAHYRVRKLRSNTEQGGTVSEINILSQHERTEEIARMLGADSTSATSLAHAQALLAPVDPAH